MKTLAVLTLALILLAVLGAPLFTAADPMAADPSNARQPPSYAHLFGTDTIGRDVWSRTLYGGRRTLAVALASTALAVAPGLLLGVAAGYRGGWLDRALMAGMDVLLAFPGLLLAMAVVAVAGYGPGQVALAVGVAGVAPYARVARSAVLAVRPALYITAAQATGAGWRRVLLHHVLPNALGPLLAFGAVTFSWSLLNAAALNFLGLGGSVSAPDWGIMLADARQAFRDAPWIGAAPGLALTAVVLAVNGLAGRAPNE